MSVVTQFAENRYAKEFTFFFHHNRHYYAFAVLNFPRSSNAPASGAYLCGYSEKRVLVHTADTPGAYTGGVCSIVWSETKNTVYLRA